MKRSGKFKVLALLMVLILVFSLAACGGGGGDDPTPTPAPPTTPGPDGGANGNGGDEDFVPVNFQQGIDLDRRVIRIGSTYPTSGAMAVIGIPVIETIRATFNRINANGGINGFELELVHYDDQNNPADGQALLERLLEEDQVYMVTFLSGHQVNTSMSYLVDFGIPVFYMASGLFEAFDAGPNIFPMQPSFYEDGRTIAARLVYDDIFGPNGDERLQPGERIGVMHIGAAQGMQYLQGLEYQLRALDRWDDVVVVGIETTAAGHVEAAVQMLADADVSVLVSFGTGVSAIQAAMSDIGLYVPHFTHYANSSPTAWPAEFYHPDRPIFSTGWADYTDPRAYAGIELFFYTMENYSGLSQREIEELQHDYFARAGFIAAMMIEQGLRRMAENGNDWSWESLFAAMEQEPIVIITGETVNYANGRRLGIEVTGLGKIFPDPDNPGTMMSALHRPFLSLEQIMAQ